MQCRCGHSEELCEDTCARLDLLCAGGDVIQAVWEREHTTPICRCLLARQQSHTGQHLLLLTFLSIQLTACSWFRSLLIHTCECEVNVMNNLLIHAVRCLSCRWTCLLLTSLPVCFWVKSPSVCRCWSPVTRIMGCRSPARLLTCHCFMKENKQKQQQQQHPPPSPAKCESNEILNKCFC